VSFSTHRTTCTPSCSAEATISKPPVVIAPAVTTTAHTPGSGPVTSIARRLGPMRTWTSGCVAASASVITRPEGERSDRVIWSDGSGMATPNVALSAPSSTTTGVWTC
jgi:hypothetical protein